MNFKYMPELEWRYGYETVIAVTVLMCIGLYARLKKAEWL
jgi:magnesium transporter